MGLSPRTKAELCCWHQQFFQAAPVMGCFSASLGLGPAPVGDLSAPHSSLVSGVEGGQWSLLSPGWTGTHGTGTARPCCPLGAPLVQQPWLLHIQFHWEQPCPKIWVKKTLEDIFKWQDILEIRCDTTQKQLWVNVSPLFPLFTCL